MYSQVLLRALLRGVTCELRVDLQYTSKRWLYLTVGFILAR